MQQESSDEVATDPEKIIHTLFMGGGSILGMNANVVANELIKREQKKIDGTVKKKPWQVRRGGVVCRISDMDLWLNRMVNR